MVDSKETLFKDYNIYIMRAHFQVRAKQKIIGSDWYKHQEGPDLKLYDPRACPEHELPEIKDVEVHKISLNVTSPNLQDLYSQIYQVCPEFNKKTNFHLYWRYSPSKILPVSNHISYLSMVSLIAKSNNNLYLVAREWDVTWLMDVAHTYMPKPEDVVLVNMVAPHQTLFTVPQENTMNIVKTAARNEFTRTYSPPTRPDESKAKEKSGKKKSSLKSKATKKNK